MKIKHITSEGMLDDIRAIGKAEQSRLWNKIGTAVRGATSELNPFKNYAEKFSQEAQAANIRLLADKYSQGWNNYWEKFSRGKNNLTLDQYKDALGRWLETNMRVRVDRTQLDKYITEMDPSYVVDYMKTHFIPQYIEGMMDPSTNIPSGETMSVRTQIGNISRDVTYQWDGRNWYDTTVTPPRAIPLYSALHNQLIQAALGEA